jgi:hypothetical protein
MPRVSRIQILDTGTLASGERKLSRCLICTFSKLLLPAGRPRPRLMVAVSVEELVLVSITGIIKAHTNEMVNAFLSKKYLMPLGMRVAMRLDPGVPLAQPHPLFASFLIDLDCPSLILIHSNPTKSN